MTRNIHLSDRRR